MLPVMIALSALRAISYGAMATLFLPLFFILFYDVCSPYPVCCQQAPDVFRPKGFGPRDQSCFVASLTLFT